MSRYPSGFCCIAVRAACILLFVIGAMVPFEESASASTASVLVVANGLPGTVIDVCVDGREVASGLNYEGSTTSALPTREGHLFKVKEAAPGECDGSLIVADRARVSRRAVWSLTTGLDEHGHAQIFLGILSEGHPLRDQRFQMVICNHAEAPRLRLYVDGDPYLNVANDARRYCWSINRLPPGEHTLKATISRTDKHVAGPRTFRFRRGHVYGLSIIGSEAAGYHFLLASVEVGTKS